MLYKYYSTSCTHSLCKQNLFEEKGLYVVNIVWNVLKGKIYVIKGSYRNITKYEWKQTTFCGKEQLLAKLSTASHYAKKTD